MKYQFTSRKPATAAASAGQRPPTAETPTTSRRKSSSTLGRPTWSRSCGEDHVSSGKPIAAEDEPSGTRRRGSAARAARAAGDRARSVRPSSTADHVHVDADAGVADHVVDHRALRQLAPARASCRAEDDLGGVQRARRLDERLADVCADDLAIACRRAARRARAAGRGASADAAARPSCGTTWTATSSPFARCGHPRRAPDRGGRRPASRSARRRRARASPRAARSRARSR